MLGLNASTGTGEGTILEFDYSGNIIPSVGTYNSMSKIDNAIGAASGICPLDSSTQVSPIYLPPATPTTIGTVYGITLGTSAPGKYNIGYGPGALNTTVSGYQNIGISNGLLSSLTSRTANMGMGAESLNGFTTGTFNVAMGPGRLQYVTTGFGNIGVGYQSGSGLTIEGTTYALAIKLVPITTTTGAQCHSVPF